MIVINRCGDSCIAPGAPTRLERRGDSLPNASIWFICELDTQERNVNISRTTVYYNWC